MMSPLLLLALGLLIVVGGILWLRLHPFLALLMAAWTVAFLTPSELPAVDRVSRALGAGFSQLAILICMAVIIGRCLLDSGAAARIVIAVRGLLGERRTSVALALSAFVLGVPVFFDTVFYLLMPLGKALWARTGRNYILYVLAIVCGATMAHSLVPPTPGPLYVASELGVDLGTMMLAGLCVGGVTVSAGYAYAVWANRRWHGLVPHSNGLNPGATQSIPGERAQESLPPLMGSLLPIVLPVLLIGGHTVSRALGWTPGWLGLIGDKNVALMIAAAPALVLLIRYRLPTSEPWPHAVQSALAGGGMILLITSAGSAFGAMLRETGVAGTVGGWMPADQSLALIPMAFLLTAAVRTAQGSATVAMISAIGMISPVVAEVDLAYHPVYLALAVGCGSKPVMWANDSGFWIIGRESGLSPMLTFQTASMQMLVMAVTGLGTVLLGAWLLPMI